MDGGSGAGVNIAPIGFIVVSGGENESCPKFIPVDHCNALDKLLDYVPNIIDKIASKCCKDDESKYNVYSYNYNCDCDCGCGCGSDSNNENKECDCGSESNSENNSNSKEN